MDISVVLSTYNRCEVLHKALECLSVQQSCGVEYEIIVVDNNSTDNTHALVEIFRARDTRIRYLFEPCQGLSYGRNAGIRAARADAIVFTDDDVEVANDWIYRIHQALSQYPEADFIGGRVLPVVSGSLPAWAHTKMAPFALQDFGDQPVVVSSTNRRCLIGACLVARRRAIATAGLFSTETQRVKDRVGSTEDADWEAQVWSYGGHGVYVPDIIVHSQLPSERLTKRYHRKWHLGHGSFHAKVRRSELEGARQLFDVPLCVYRQAMESTIQLAALSLKRRTTQAFERENLLMFCIGFIAERWKTQLVTRQPATRTAPVNSLAS